MQSRTAAFEEARAGLGRLGLPAVLPTLHAAGVGIRRTVLGGSHSVAVYPPIDSLTPLNPSDVLAAVNCGRQASLYVHIAFCETRCTFCHYTVSHYTGPQSGGAASERPVTQYLAALTRELESWGERLARSATVVSSIYIGGGTPLILETGVLSSLIHTIQNAFDILPGAEFCIEGSPLTITAPDGEDKLRCLKSHGITRLSFGVQSFDDAVLKYAARGYKGELAIHAASIANRVFDNWNLDLIQGLYKGSPSETWENLQVLAEIRPPHLTWYHGRFADRPQGDWYNNASKHASFEDEAATLLGRMLIWQEMAALGYQQTDGNRFVLEGQYTDPFKKIRTSASSNLVGVGAASYSHCSIDAAGSDGRGYVFRNETTITGYVNRIAAGCIPIATGRIVDDSEVLAMSYATGLRVGRIDTDELRSIQARQPELASHYAALAVSLREIGVLETYVADESTPGLRMSMLGRLFEDEALALFFSPAVKRTLSLKQPIGVSA